MIKTKNMQWLTGLAAIVLLITCKTASTNGQNFGTESENILKQHALSQRATQQKDTSLLDKLYTEQAVSLRQNEPACHGRIAIIERWKGAFKGPFTLEVHRR